MNQFECKKTKKECTIEENDYKDICNIKMKLPDKYLERNKCLNYNFLVNIVPQSLDSFGIYDNKLAYAAKNDKTNYFMIGDMANAYPAGISVEIGINFVNYIIPIFYNFYINEDETILECKDLNIVELLQDLLSDKYTTLLIHETNIEYAYAEPKSKYTLKALIEGIKNYYNDNLSTQGANLCYNDDIFLTYYNIVLLIQFIKNADLILNNKKILAISQEFQPNNYQLIDKEFVKEGKRYNGKLQSLR